MTSVGCLGTADQCKGGLVAVLEWGTGLDEIALKKGTGTLDDRDCATGGWAPGDPGVLADRQKDSVVEFLRGVPSA